MNEVENEDLVFTLETVVDKFGEEMAPYALGLCQNLVSTCVHYLLACLMFMYHCFRLILHCSCIEHLAWFVLTGCCLLEVLEYI